ncbi:MAG: hypothetical protein QXJ17_00235 [Nitrososphaeria archaeon]
MSYKVELDSSKNMGSNIMGLEDWVGLQSEESLAISKKCLHINCVLLNCCMNEDKECPVAVVI